MKQLYYDLSSLSTLSSFSVPYDFGTYAIDGLKSSVVTDSCNEDISNESSSILIDNLVDISKSLDEENSFFGSESAIRIGEVLFESHQLPHNKNYESVDSFEEKKDNFQMNLDHESDDTSEVDKYNRMAEIRVTVGNNCESHVNTISVENYGTKAHSSIKEIEVFEVLGPLQTKTFQKEVNHNEMIKNLFAVICDNQDSRNPDR